MGPEMHTFCDLYTCSLEMFSLMSIHDIYRMCSMWHPSMVMHLSAQTDHRGNDCAHTVLDSSMFTLSVTETDFTTKRRHPLWTSEQISESMHFRTHVYWTFLLSSDIRSEGSIAILKKFDYDFFMNFHCTVYHSHGLKMCFRKNVCVCVCVCLSVCLTVAERRT